MDGNWRDATTEELTRWPTLAMLKKHFADARIVRDHGVYMKYQVKENDDQE